MQLLVYPNHPTVSVTHISIANDGLLTLPKNMDQLAAKEH